MHFVSRRSWYICIANTDNYEVAAMKTQNKNQFFSFASYGHKTNSKLQILKLNFGISREIKFEVDQPHTGELLERTTISLQTDRRTDNIKNNIVLVRTFVSRWEFWSTFANHRMVLINTSIKSMCCQDTKLAIRNIQELCNLRETLSEWKTFEKNYHWIKLKLMSNKECSLVRYRVVSMHLILKFKWFSSRRLTVYMFYCGRFFCTRVKFAD